MLTKKDKEKLNTGDICPECKKGKIALMSGLLSLMMIF